MLAAGAWTDEMIRRFEIPMDRPMLRRTKGVHIVLPRERLPLARAITLISPVDGRVMFALPWRDRTVLGTTDTDFAGTADEVAADASDVKYLCDSGNGYFPGANLVLVPRFDRPLLGHELAHYVTDHYLRDAPRSKWEWIASRVEHQLYAFKRPAATPVAQAPATLAHAGATRSALD